MDEVVERYRNKKILILGLAKSGFAVSQVLLDLGAQLVVNDAKDLSDDLNAQALQKRGVKIISGSHPDNLVDESFSYVIKNPGIPYSNPIVQQAESLKIPILTEPEIAYEISQAPFVAITGSNGKTTTTLLTTQMLATAVSGEAIAVGNIGVPMTDVAKSATKDDVLVAETSSFQLMGVTEFHPHVAAIVDIYPTHIDYHGTIEAYVDAKLKITKNQTAADFFVVNFDQKDVLQKEIAATKAQIVTFSMSDNEADYYLHDGEIFAKSGAKFAVADIKLPGRHNIQNILVAIAIAEIYHVQPESILHVLQTFSGVKHRLQFVTEIKDRKFYNDSKATNIEAATVAINSFDQPEVLIAGGLDRGFVFDDLIKPFKEHVRALVAYGETKELLADAAKKAGIQDIMIVEDLSEAVFAAWEISRENDIILFSPACASWDQFENFEQRGDVFIQNVEKIRE